jgi:hypothetical protein
MSALPVSGEVGSGHTNALASSVRKLLAFGYRDSKNKLFDDASVTAVGDGVVVTLVIDGETHDLQETRELVAANPSAHPAFQNKAESGTCAGDKQNGDRCGLKVPLTIEYCHFHGLPQSLSARIRGDGPLATKCASNVCSVNASIADGAARRLMLRGARQIFLSWGVGVSDSSLFIRDCRFLGGDLSSI